MSNTNGALSFEADIQTTNFERSIRLMEQRVRGLSGTAVQEGSRIDSVFQSLGKYAAGAFAFSGLAELPQQLLRVRGEFQGLSIAFTQLLGSKEKADAFLREGADLASRSPLEMGDVAKGQQLLLSYGVEVQKVIPTLERLSDIAAGTGANFNELVAAYGQINTQGTAQWDDLTKFMERGVSLVPALATQLKIADKDVKQFVADGKVGFADIEKAIISLTDGSAKINFGGLGAAKVDTLPGQISALSDAYEQALNKIGAQSEGVISASIKGATELVKNYQPILDILTVLIATYGAYKAATIAVSVVQRINLTLTQAEAVAKAAAAAAGQTLTASELRQAAATSLLTQAQARLNAVLLANPYALAAAAVVALTVGIAVYSKELDAAGQAEQAMAEVRSKATEEAQSEVAKIELLKVAINNEKLSRQERNKSLQDLIALSPQHLGALTLENIKTNEGTTAINGYVQALRRKFEYQQIDAKLTESFKRANAAQNDETEFSTIETIG